MSTATQGRSREYRVRDAMERVGWYRLNRSAGSKGVTDLVMFHPDHGQAFVQVGTANKQLGPYSRQALLYAADICYAAPVLAQVMPRAGIKFWRVAPGPASTWESWSP